VTLATSNDKGITVNPSKLNALLDLQKKDLTLLQLKKEARGIPERTEQLREQAKGAAEELERCRQAVRVAEAAIREVELEVEAVEEQITKYKNQQMQARTNEEYKAFEREIATAQEKISQLEERELEEMEKLESARDCADKALVDKKAADEKAEKNVRELEERHQVVRDTFADIKAEREQLVKEVDPEIADRYMTLLTKMQSAVLVPVRQQSCGGCHMKLTPQILHDAHSQKKWTTCTFCGRLLYDPQTV